MVTSHYDGHEETSFAHCTNGVSRLVGSCGICTNPASLLVHFIDEGTENTSLMWKYFNDAVTPDLADMYANKLPVTCFNVDGCQMCQKGHPRTLSLDNGEFELWQHFVDFLQLYICDGKMFFEMLPLKNGQCRQCKASLATGDHNIRSNLIPAEPHTIEEFQHAHNRFMHHYREFVRKNQEKHLVLLAGTMSTATLNLFYASEDFKNFEDEYVDGVGTNSAKLGDRYKGLLVDQLTPL